ncbi:MAG TPA: sigma-70 family RNA polymerase sigma factor [Verrucomicrobiota bacterium]|nr:sigma-70 family RNA polymerase sigma factor [Verrucomicrobiota bacterium]
MPASTVSPSEATEPQRYFATTHWSVVLTAGQSNPSRANLALEELCQTYWYPLYAYVRRRGYSAHDAQDLTQGFFACLLERQSLANADPHKGRFRSFMLGAMNYFLASEGAKLQTQKRGGGHQMLPLDLAAAEQRFDLESADHAAPDNAFDKEWATALLDKVLSQLEQDYRREQKIQLFDTLKQTLAGARESQPYATLAAQLNMNEGAVKTAVHRLRKRYRELLQAEIANTVTSPEEVKTEMSYLFKVMADR